MYNGVLRPGFVGLVPDDVGVLGGRKQEVRRFGNLFAGDLDQGTKLFPYLEERMQVWSKTEFKLNCHFLLTRASHKPLMMLASKVVKSVSKIIISIC